MGRPKPDGRGWTQVQLAEVSGISRETIHNILHEKVDAQDETIERLAEVLQFPLANVEVFRRRKVAGVDVLGGVEEAESGEGQESSGLEPQFDDDDVLDLLLFNRHGFTRYLMTRFDTPQPLPVQAKLGFLDHIERIASERGIALPKDHLDHLRGVIRGGGL